MTTPARQLHTQQIHYLRVNVNFNSNAIAGGIVMGALPAGAQITDMDINVLTAFNAGTTNVLTVGTTPTGAQILTNSETIPGTAGYRSGTTGGALSFATDTPLYVSYTQTGTAATTGSAVIVISYAPNNDVML